MSGFDLSTGSIDLISQPGDVPLDGGSSGPSCNHSCPKCCPPVPPEPSECPATFIGFLATIFLFVVAFMCIVGLAAFLSGPS